MSKKKSNGCRSGNASVKSYRLHKFKSALCYQAGSVIVMDEAIKRVYRNRKRSSHWSVYVTRETCWSPVPAISLPSHSGGCFVAYTTVDVVFARQCSVTFQSGCTGMVRRALSRRWIGRGPEGSVSWPPRSPDSNPIDSYFCGSMKNVNIGNTRAQI
jgi:hypothetical protein